MGTGWETNHIVPGGKSVRLTLFWGHNYFGNIHKDCIDKARAMLQEHGLKLDLVPVSGTPSDAFRVGIPVGDDGLLYPDDYNELRNRCAAKYDDQTVEPKRQRLPVVFCQFKHPANGLTTDPRGTWLPWCMVGPTADATTLLHEAGHASGLPHLTTSVQQGAAQNFMFDGGGDRSLMHKAQLEKFSQAYFVV